MSLFTNIKNNKFYYPPIVKVKNNNIHLSNLNNKNTRIKKSNNNALKNINRIFHITKSNSYSNISNGTKKNDFFKEADDTSLLINLKNRNNSKNEKNNKYFDSESLYEKNIQLKTEINQIKQELLQMKCENQRKEKEIMKKDKLLLTAFDKKNNEEIDLNGFFPKDKNENDILDKNLKKNNYMAKFRQQYMELKKNYEEKIAQINSLKKNIKNTKINELILQNKEILKEFNKFKDLYNNLFIENKKNLDKIRKMSDLENEINNKNLIILQLQESLKISSAKNIQYENDLEDMKIKITNLQVENKSLLDKLKKLQENLNNKIVAKKRNSENKFFMLYNNNQNEPRKSEINFNNTNRSFMKENNRINTDIRSKNHKNTTNISDKRKKLSISPKKIPTSANNSNIKKFINNNDINNSINDIKKDNNNELNILNIKENENITNNEDDNNLDINENVDNASINDVSETEYILIKNFEACKISKEDSLTLIIKPILNGISNEKQIKNDVLVNLFTDKICECINCTKNNNDITSINNVINSLLSDSKYELFTFIKSFIDIFDSVKIYKDNSSEEEGIIKKINTSLFQYKEYFENSYTNEFISFFSFRGLLNNKKIILDDESIEFLIYRMKKDCPNIISKNSKQNENIINNENNDNNNDNNEKIITNIEEKNTFTSNYQNNSIIINFNNGKSINLNKEEMHNNNANNAEPKKNNEDKSEIIINENNNEKNVGNENNNNNNNDKNREENAENKNGNSKENNSGENAEDKNGNSKENKNEENNANKNGNNENNGEISTSIILDNNNNNNNNNNNSNNINCSIFDLNYKTFLSLI